MEHLNNCSNENLYDIKKSVNGLLSGDAGCPRPWYTQAMIWIAGAACVDVVAMKPRFIDGTSNPSTFHIGVGGVGFNIFRSCRAPARFITALGRDLVSGIARETLRSFPGVLVRDLATGHPAIYAAFMEDGRLKMGASDLSALEAGLDADFILDAVGEPEAGDIVVLDGNLSADAVKAVVERLSAKARVVFEPVSVEKSLRHRASLKGCWLATPSEKEAAALVRGSEDGGAPGGGGAAGAAGAPGGGAAITDEEVAAWIQTAGPASLLVTRGERGTSLFDAGGRKDFPPGRVARTADSTGAGDLLVAALLGLLSEGKGLAESVVPAMAVVEQALQKGRE